MSESPISEQCKLSDSIKITTSAPFVEYQFGQDPDQPPTLIESGDKKVHVEICSELTTYNVNTEVYEKNGRVQLVHDSSSQPAVFSLNAENRICLLRYVPGASQGWSSRIISPEGSFITAFDVLQSENYVLLAAIESRKSDRGETYHLSYTKVVLDVGGMSTPQGGSEVWNELKDNIDRPVGALHLTTVMWRGLPDLVASEKQADLVEGEKQAFYTVVGTQVSGSKTGSIYSVLMDVTAQNPWTKLTFPIDVAELLQISPMSLPGGENAVVSISQDTVDSKPRRCVGHIFGSDGGFVRQFEAKAGSLRGVNSVFSHLNPWNTTDLILAGNNGIGVCDSTQSYDTVSNHILEGIALKQVVCSEVEDPDRPSTHTRLSMFAVSKDDELYYIDGERNYAADEPRLSFQWSGLPIRNHVSQVSTRYNPLQGSSELLFASDNDNALKFLRREPSGRSWVEDRITVRGKSRKTLKFDAFVTSLVFTDGHGKPVLPNYKVKLTSEPLHIVSNDRCFAIGRKETVLTTDDNGSILIVIPANGKISCPSLELCMAGFKFTVDPSQRVDRLLGNLNSEASLSGARAANGDMIFAGCSGQTISDAAGILGQYNDIRGGVTKPSLNGRKDIDLSVSHQDQWGEQFDSLTANSWGSWFDKATTWASNFVGDCIEAIKYVAKQTVKLAIKIAGPVVKAVIKVGKALCAFVVKTVGPVLTAVGSFLENILGVEFVSKLVNYLRVVFDPSTIQATQEVLKHAINGCIGLAHRFLLVNRASISDLFENAEELLKRYIGDPGDLPQASRDKTDSGGITNNPVLRLISKIDPLAWILEAISEEMSDVKTPSFEPIINGILKVLGPEMLDRASLVTKLWDIFAQALSTVLSNPSEILPTLIKALRTVAMTLTRTVKNAALALYDVLLLLLRELPSILASVWKLGCLTEIWEELTGQDFSFMTFLTYPIALYMNAVSIGIGEKLAFDGIAQDVKEFNFDNVEVRPFYKREQKGEANQAAGTGTEWTQHAASQSSLIWTRDNTSYVKAEVDISMSSNSSPHVESNSAMSTKETIRNILVILENASRLGITIDLFMEANRIENRRNDLIADYKSGGISLENLKVAIAGQNNRPNGYEITKWRSLGVIFHAMTIIAGTVLNERSRLADPYIDGVIAVTGLGELVLTLFAFCGANVDQVLRGAGCVAQLNTVLRSAREKPFGWPSAMFITSATSGVVAFVFTRAREVRGAKISGGIDCMANMGGIGAVIWQITR